MSSTINTNISSLNSQSSLARSQVALTTSMQRLSSGLRVNSAKDDAAGLAIATRMDAVSRGQAVAIRNINDGISLLQTADGTLGSANEIFQRMRELVIQGANGTNGPSDLQAIADEIRMQLDTLESIFQQTSFNGTKILGNNGGAFWTETLQIGPESANKVDIKVFEASFDQFGDPTGYPTLLIANGGFEDILNTDAAKLKAIDQSLDAINSGRAIIGAQLNTLESTIANLRVANENSESARGRIMDADYAQETASLSRQQILQQAGTSMVAQANIQPQSVLKLLML